MTDKLVVKRYAEAFLDYTRRGVGVERVLEDFKTLREIIRVNPEFLEFLESPEITFAEKCSLIDKVMQQDFSEEIRNFLKLLLEHSRIDKVIDIAEYARITYSNMGEAILKTSYPLDLKLIKRIEDKLEKKFSKKFKFYINLDATLLGGIQITIGNNVIDGSVRKRLEELREMLTKIRIA